LPFVRLPFPIPRSCSCYLFCGNQFRSCYGEADDGDAVAVWRGECDDEPLACSIVKEQTRRFLLRPAQGRKATEGWQYVHARAVFLVRPLQ
jgi:hypothetical protein